MKRTLIALSFVLLAVSILRAQKPIPPQTFESPEAARDALIQAAETGGGAAETIFGSGAREILSTGDPIEDNALRERFGKAAHEKTQLEVDPMNANRVTVLIGEIEWPFGVPLVRKDGRWLFDVQAGKTEIRNRIIGFNEMDAIDICHGYVEAQREYAAKDWNGDGWHEYAARIVSTSGKKDGLYWPGDDSPVAAAFAKATAQGYRKTSDQPQPFHGYFYKILTAQGPEADDGERDYVVKNMMIGGFALVAWPAQYGVSGIKTFIVNQDAVVYEKDLGPKTASLAAAMTKFNPDGSWMITTW